ncbi:MAG TPA: type II toxin-antitoxin system RelE/ParE family toxin [Phycisphaerales bacterium]|nr:type II toxin-antitoxin system RelE/ParE family toxin [Phycisphaerales bacterium]
MASPTPGRFLVITMPRAYADLLAIHEYIGAGRPRNADAVVPRLVDAIARLERMPRRCAAAREAGEFEGELRQMVVSGFRIVFQIRDNRVEVLAIVHTSRRNVEDFE